MIIATKNSGKLAEYKELLNFTKYLTLNDFEDDSSVEENGSSFLENALIKAKYYANKYNDIVIADDSGLVVRSLDGLPGVNSKRYSENDLSNNLKLLNAMRGQKDRYAYFITVLVIYNPNGRYFHFDGVLEGQISLKQSGNNGFGYDPIFIPQGYSLTLAELSIEIKNQISHRSKAVRKLKEQIDEIFSNW